MGFRPDEVARCSRCGNIHRFTIGAFREAVKDGYHCSSCGITLFEKEAGHN